MLALALVRQAAGSLPGQRLQGAVELEISLFFWLF